MISDQVHRHWARFIILMIIVAVIMALIYLILL